MAFNIDAIGGWSNGNSGSLTMPGGNVTDRAYQVQFANGSTTGKASTDTFGSDVCWVQTGSLADEDIPDMTVLSVGTQLFFHNVALKNTSCTDTAIIGQLGYLQFATIVSSTGTTATLDREVTLDLNNFYVQAVVIHNFTTLTLDGLWQGFEFNPNYMLGGVRIIKANVIEFNANSGIDLRGCGMPASCAANRPLLIHEQQGTNDADILSGYENTFTPYNFTLNVGDGACMLIANQIIVDVNNSGGYEQPVPPPTPTPTPTSVLKAGDITVIPPVIGNLAYSKVQYCRGADDSPNKKSGYTNVGGSTIVVVTQKIDTSNAPFYVDPRQQTFLKDLIGKYRTGSSNDGLGKGLGRAYVAVPYINDDTPLYSDEGLYALDVIHDTSSYVNARNYLRTIMNVKYFGHGVKAGNWIAPSGTNIGQNRFAKITSYSTDYKTCTLGSKLESDGMPEFAVGTMVMVHHRVSYPDHMYDGSFFLARITGVSGDTVTLDFFGTTFAGDAFGSDAYNMQLITIPEYENFTVKGSIGSFSYNSVNKIGGICAIAVKDTLDLRGGKVDATGRGTGVNPQFPNPYIGSAFMSTHLPIGAGHGSIFILANNILMDADTRIGATYTGSAFGGGGNVYPANHGGYTGQGHDAMTGGSGGSGGSGRAGYGGDGGWHSNTNNAVTNGGRQGAHILIVANKITGFNLAAISTGGEGGQSNTVGNARGGSGGAGYGGGGCYGAVGGFQGGGGGYADGQGGGGAGACFIYCNEYEYADFTRILTG